MSERQLVTVEEARKDLVVDEKVETLTLESRDIQVGSDHDVFTPLNVTFSKRATSKLCLQVQVPGKFYQKCNPETRQAILKQALQLPTKVKVTLSGNVITNVMDADAVYHPPVKVFDTSVEAIQKYNYPLKGVMDFWSDESHSVFNFITDKADHPVNRVGELTHAGVGVFYNDSSYPGAAIGLDVASYLYTLVCTNGLVSPQRFNFAVQHTNGDFSSKLQDTVGKALSFTNTFLHQFIKLDEQQLTNPAEFLTRLVGDSGLGRRELPSLIELLAALPEKATAYDIVNLVTSYANELDPRKRSRLQELGGHLTTAVHEHRCQSCRRTI